MARRQWFDVPDTTTPLSASFLNDLEARKPETDYMAVNVKDYGAAGDGAQNDTAAVTAAFNDALGKTLYFPAGEYVITAGLAGVTPHTKICGAGKGTSILKYTGSGTALTWGEGTSSSNNQFVLQDICIEGTAAGAAGLKMHGFQDFTLLNCDMTEFATGYAVWLDNVNCGTAINTDATKSAVGWRLTNNANLNTIIGGQITDNGYGINVATYAEANTWLGCNIAASYQPYAVYLQAGQLNTIQGCYFEINTAGGGTASIFIGDLGDVTSAHFTRILYNRFTETNVNYGVYVYRGNETLIQGNLHGGTGSGGFVQIDGTNGIDTVVRDNVKGTAEIISTPGLRTRASGPGFETEGTVASAATIAIPPGPELVTVTGTTGITSITAAYAGRQVTLVFSGILTVTDGSNLKLSANFTTSADDSLTLISDGTNWVEIARSVN